MERWKKKGPIIGNSVPGSKKGKEKEGYRMLKEEAGKITVTKKKEKISAEDVDEELGIEQRKMIHNG